MARRSAAEREIAVHRRLMQFGEAESLATPMWEQRGTSVAAIEAHLAHLWAATSTPAAGADAILLDTPEGERRLKNDFVLAMTGYHPDFGFLRALGVETHLVVSKAAEMTIGYETEMTPAAVRALADVVYPVGDLGARDRTRRRAQSVRSRRRCRHRAARWPLPGRRWPGCGRPTPTAPRSLAA